MESNLALAVERAALRATRESGAPLVVAVSGGLDSMVLLHALARSAPRRISAVATFDHGSGVSATRAVAHVQRAGDALGLDVVVGRRTGPLDVREGREAAWRDARYEFLRSEAEIRRARIVTAHTRDDQVETVLMRVIRGSGARGLAALYAPSAIARPFLDVTRATLERYAREERITWTDDPSNRSRDFFRNRIRLDILPALRRVMPDIDEELLSLAQRASAVRRDVEHFIDSRLQVDTVGSGRLIVGARELAGLGDDSLRTVWGALAGRVGLSLDRRGTTRIAEFTMKQPRAGWIPLSGGWQLEAVRDQYRLYRSESTWIPDVRRSDAATARSGRPVLH